MKKAVEGNDEKIKKIADFTIEPVNQLSEPGNTNHGGAFAPRLWVFQMYYITKQTKNQYHITKKWCFPRYLQVVGNTKKRNMPHYVCTGMF